LDEVQTVLLLQDGVGTLTRATRDVLADVVTNHGLDLLGLEATLDDQAMVTVDGTAGTEFGKGVGQDVLGASVHGLADLLEVHPDGLLGAVSHHLWWLHDVTILLRLHQVWVVLVEQVEDPVQQLGVVVVSVTGGPRGSLLLLLWLLLSKVHIVVVSGLLFSLFVRGCWLFLGLRFFGRAFFNLWPSLLLLRRIEIEILMWMIDCEYACRLSFVILTTPRHELNRHQIDLFQCNECNE